MILKLFDPTYYDSTENAIYSQHIAEPKTFFYVGKTQRVVAELTYELNTTDNFKATNSNTHITLS